MNNASNTLKMPAVVAGFVALGLGVVAAIVALPSSAASSDYAFLNRGIVQSVDTTNNIVVVKSTKSSTKAIADTQSKDVQYSLKTAQVYKWENGVKVPRNIHHIKPNDEVVLDGNKKGGSYIVDTLTVNDRTFYVVGRVKDYNTTQNWIKVVVGRSTLQHAGVVNTEIKFYYEDGDNNTKCYRLGSSIDCSEITAQNQGIKIYGERSSNGGTWNAKKFWNNYPI